MKYITVELPDYIDLRYPVVITTKGSMFNIEQHCVQAEWTETKGDKDELG